MSIFDEFRLAVGDLLTELGAALSIEKVERIYSEFTRATSEVRTAYPGLGALTPPSGASNQGERAADATLTTQQYAVVGSFPAGIEPAVDDAVIIGGRRFRINGVTPIRPDGEAMAWRLALEDS